MKKELKQLLLVDLGARLAYGIFVKDKIDEKSIYTMDYHPLIDNCKPYLRPLSSMTEEERDILRSLDGFIQIDIQNGIVEGSYDVFDYLNSIHVSYRTFNGKDMFELGLALVAPEGMYNIKEI